MPLLLVAAGVLGGGCETEETGGGDAPACEDLLIQEPCLDCLETSCCEQVQACIADQEEGGCAACIQGDAEACTASPIAIDLYSCLLGSCAEVCSEDAPGAACDAPADPPSGGSCVTVEGAAECNPVTNAECDDAAGEACDYEAGQLRCFPGPNDRALCEACGAGVGNCGPGLSCFQQVTIGAGGVAVRGTCARTCCDDGDCGDGVCGAQVSAEGQTVGVCLERSE